MTTAREILLQAELAEAVLRAKQFLDQHEKTAAELGAVKHTHYGKWTKTDEPDQRPEYRIPLDKVP